MLKKNNELENIHRPWKKIQNLINIGSLIMHAVGPDKKFKINKQRAYFYSRL
jgi:hypothetical protein